MHKYFNLDTKVFIASVVYCVPLAGVAATKNLIVNVECSMCTKMLILISPLPNICIPCVEAEQKETNIALSIPFRLLNKAIFGLGGLEFCQKMWN